MVPLLCICHLPAPRLRILSSWICPTSFPRLFPLSPCTFAFPTSQLTLVGMLPSGQDHACPMSDVPSRGATQPIYPPLWETRNMCCELALSQGLCGSLLLFKNIEKGYLGHGMMNNTLFLPFSCYY